MVGLNFQNDYDNMIVIEFIIQHIPCYLFLIAAAQRYYNIKHVAISKPIHLSTLGSLKVTFSYIMMFIYVINIILALCIRDREIFWIAGNFKLALLYFINVFSWFICEKLMKYEKSKLLEETFYVHHFFWILSFVCYLIGTFYLAFVTHIKYGLTLVIKIIELLGSIGFILILFRRKRKSDSFNMSLGAALNAEQTSYISTELNETFSMRTQRGPMPNSYTIPNSTRKGSDNLMNPSSNNMSENTHIQTKLIDESTDPTIDILMKRKIKHAKTLTTNDKARFPEKEYVFVFVVIIDRIKPRKVRKSLFEFVQLEKILNSEYSNKIYRKYEIQVPKIDKNLLNIKHNNTNEFLEYRINNLEKFLKTLATKKIFWCRTLLNFFEIDEEEQNKFLKLHQISLKYNVENNVTPVEKKKEKERAGSSEIPSYLSDVEIENNLSIIDPNAKDKIPSTYNFFSYIAGIKGYAGIGKKDERKPSAENIACQITKNREYQNMRMKSSNELFKYFSVRIERLQKGQGGDYIEYVIRITDKQMPDRPWTIIRRFNDFIKLHSELSKNISKNDLPKLPKRVHIENLQDIEALSARRVQLESYLRVLLNKRDNHVKALIDFIELPSMRGGRTGNVMRTSIIETMYQLNPDDEFDVNINSYRVALVKGKARTLYKVVFTLKVKKRRYGLIVGEEMPRTFETEKKYKDFERLHVIMEGVVRDTLENKEDLPKLPSKVSSFGGKKPAAEIQKDLERYLKETIKNKNLALSSPVSLFFGTEESVSASISASTMDFGKKKNNKKPFAIDIDDVDDDSIVIHSPNPYFLENSKFY